MTILRWFALIVRFILLSSILFYGFTLVFCVFINYRFYDFFVKIIKKVPNLNSICTDLNPNKSEIFIWSKSDPNYFGSDLKFELELDGFFPHLNYSKFDRIYSNSIRIRNCLALVYQISNFCIGFVYQSHKIEATILLIAINQLNPSLMLSSWAIQVQGIFRSFSFIFKLRTR